MVLPNLNKLRSHQHGCVVGFQVGEVGHITGVEYEFVRVFRGIDLQEDSCSRAELFMVVDLFAVPFRYCREAGQEVGFVDPEVGAEVPFEFR